MIILLRNLLCDLFGNCSTTKGRKMYRSGTRLKRSTLGSPCATRTILIACCVFVTKLQPGATPMTCTEAVFEDALRQTNTRCHAFFRGLPSAAHYQGPQCFSERRHAAKVVFDPCQMPSGARTRQSYSDRSFLVLQCCAEGCEKWRRVDSAT